MPIVEVDIKLEHCSEKFDSNMVGVPGKYKGCNTCRTRRVKCDNTRPFCKKCTDYGRECGGYERETVFIVGTQDDKGRCTSHPPRNAVNSKRTPTESRKRKTEKRVTRAAEPLKPAWNEKLTLDSSLGLHEARIVAHLTNLDFAMQETGSVPPSSSSSYCSTPPRQDEITLSLPSSGPLDPTPTFGHEPFSLKSSCMIQVPENTDSLSMCSDDSLCLFLYEQNSSASYESESSWNDPALLGHPIKGPGPSAYQYFPAHHFFARVYRPSVIWAALLNRQPTFLCSPEWTVVPWEYHPRTSLDDLLDIVVLLPSIYPRADSIASLQSSTSRNLKARDLLKDCMSIEAQFDFWYAMVQHNADGGVPFWAADALSSDTRLPFGNSLVFSDPHMCMVHICYWAVLVSFHQCIHSLLSLILESGSEGLAEMPVGIDIHKYQPSETRILATNVCRSLDFALRTTGQPDLLAAPFWIVNDFYTSAGQFGADGLESLWCSSFQERLKAKSREMGSWLQEKRWYEAGRFG
ncbi:hypothetical protein F5Y15DRAFT_417497 [Xylariaceae sp. FL0016]|nr:hypothetical protein F5Y15DRAFT_417497 [Xylariaceae sp. FL0016]